MLSTYLPNKSTSIFTILPISLSSKFVFCNVCGITDTVRKSFSNFTIVRLTPSIAIEPLEITYFNKEESSLNFKYIELSNAFLSTKVATPSICPATKCPPNLSLAFIALSKFTLLPALNSAKLVLYNVSGITSTENKFLSNIVTVKHIPFTDILSPILTSDSTFFAEIVKIIESPECLISFNNPISSINPVNKCTLTSILHNFLFPNIIFAFYQMG